MTDLDACALPHPRLPLAELPPEVAEHARMAGVTSFLGQFGHAPGLIEGWMAWYQPMMLGGRVPTRTKELCRLAIAARTGCHLCQNGRFPDPASSGGNAVTEEEAASVLAGAFGDFEPDVQAALGWAVAYWDDHRAIPDDVIERATDALGYDGFLEVAVMVAQFTGMGRLFSALGMSQG